MNLAQTKLKEEEQTSETSEESHTNTEDQAETEPQTSSDEEAVELSPPEQNSVDTQSSTQAITETLEGLIFEDEYEWKEDDEDQADEPDERRAEVEHF